MAAAASPQGDESPKKRRPVPQGIEVLNYSVSRNSGLDAERTTFGVGNRFQSNEKVVGRGRDSPTGREFYGRNPLWKLKMEVGPQPSQGIGARKDLADRSVPRKVGPGSYNIVASAAYPRSPLDGPDYCLTSIHKKLPSTLVPVDMCSPGPHHTYEVRKPLDQHLPGYGRQNLSYGGRHPPIEDTDGPGLAYNDQWANGVSKSVSTPNLGDSKLTTEAGGTKRCVKSTFGTADRFSSARQSSSPVGDMYYAHSKQMDGEDYMAAGRTCGFGGGSKTDFANPYKGHQMAVSPVTYRPVASSAKKTSAFDGLTSRNESAVVAYCRSMGCSTRSRSSPKTLMGKTSPSSTMRKVGQKTPTSHGKGAAVEGSAASPSAEGGEA